jgi:hypothetical protein
VIEVKKLISKFLAHSVVVGELELTIESSRFAMDSRSQYA